MHTLKKQRIIKEKDNLMIKFNEIPNFYLEMDWKFESNYIPFISKIAPSDIFKIYKYNNHIAYFNNLKLKF